MFRSTSLALIIAALAGGTALASGQTPGTARHNDGKPFATASAARPAPNIEVAGVARGGDGKARGIEAVRPHRGGRQIAALPTSTDLGR